MLCIQALERHLSEDDTVVDVGTGSGVLSIAAAKLGAIKIDALDLDEVAVNSARLNIKLNKVQNIVSVKQGNLLENVEGSPEIIVANILADVIVKMTDDAFRVLKPGGKIITSGIIQGKRTDVKDAMKASGFEIIEIVEMEDWLAIIGKKPE